MGGIGSISDNDRGLIFPESVINYFSFLDSLGFAIIERSPLTVRYSRDKLVVMIYYGRLSYIMGVDISYEGEDYSLYDILSFIGISDSKVLTGYAAVTAEQICVGLSGLAESLKTYAPNALKGDEHFYQRLKLFKYKAIERYQAEALYRQISPEANEAFRLKDYVRAISLYEKISSSLAPSENKKLVYAREKSKIDS